jgi:hypothetical protein
VYLKALQGLQLLVGRIQSLQETDNRFPFKGNHDYIIYCSVKVMNIESFSRHLYASVIMHCLILTAQLPLLYVLVSSWQKLELESWPAMVSGVQEKHDASAGRVSQSVPFFFWMHDLHSLLQVCNICAVCVTSSAVMVPFEVYPAEGGLVVNGHKVPSSSVHKCQSNKQKTNSKKIYVEKYVPLFM